MLKAKTRANTSRGFAQSQNTVRKFDETKPVRPFASTGHHAGKGLKLMGVAEDVAEAHPASNK